MALSSLKSVTHYLQMTKFGTVITPYIKKIQKTYELHHTPLEFG